MLCNFETFGLPYARVYSRLCVIIDYHAAQIANFSTKGATITVGVTAESAVTPTVYGSRKKKGHELPKLNNISASKAEINRKMAQISCV